MLKELYGRAWSFFWAAVSSATCCDSQRLHLDHRPFLPQNYGLSSSLSLLFIKILTLTISKRNYTHGQALYSATAQTATTTLWCLFTICSFKTSLKSWSRFWIAYFILTTMERLNCSQKYRRKQEICQKNKRFIKVTSLNYIVQA